MTDERQVIALAGVGCLGYYFCEEFLADKRYDVVVLSRKNENKWLHDRNIMSCVSDYSEESVLSILDSNACTALISLIACPDDLYVGIHRAFLNACIRSKRCKRLIPSEWIGDSEAYPLLPRSYGKEREVFREILRKSSGIQWTLFNGGWLMDYFLPEEKTYMTPVPGKFPIDCKGWRACIRGTGDEIQTWTWSRNIAKSVVELLSALEWDRATYVAGEWGTFNEAVKSLEQEEGKIIFNLPVYRRKHYTNWSHLARAMKIDYKSKEDMLNLLSCATADGELTEAMEIAELDEWMITGASACPREKTLLQREMYFKNVKFSNVKELLKEAENQTSSRFKKKAIL